MAMAENEAAFHQTVNETCERLRLLPCTAVILLERYNWNRAALVADFGVMRRLSGLLRQCPLVIPTNVVWYEHCYLCNRRMICEQLQCSHHLCTLCSTEALGQLRAGIFPRCPVPNCENFLNIATLPQAAHDHIMDLLMASHAETLDRRTNIKKCMDFAWRHKKKLAFMLALGWCLGYGLYQVERWKKRHPIKSTIIKYGFAIFRYAVGAFLKYLTGTDLQRCKLWVQLTPLIVWSLYDI